MEEIMTQIIPLYEINFVELPPRKLPEDIEDGVQDYWRELIVRYPGMFNGPVYSTLNMNNEDGKATLECELSDYAHYKYSEITDMGEYACRNTYAGCVVVSSDNRLFVSVNGEGSEFVGKLQIIGGAIDPNDRIIGGSLESEDEWKQNPLSPVSTALRELGEEVGSEIRNSITEIGRSYLVTNGRKYGIHTVVYSCLNSEEIYAAFESFKKKTGNNEIDKLVSFGKEDEEELIKYESCQDLDVVDLMRLLLSQNEG